MGSLVFWEGILAIILGLAWGSFLNVVIYRLDDLKSIIKTPSHCPKCKARIKWYDNIPLFSFLLLWGKCRSCRKPISWQYPLVEAITALLFALVWLKFNVSWESLLLILIFSALLVNFVYDLKNLLVVEEFVWLALILVVGWWLVLIFEGKLSLDLNLVKNLGGAVLLGGGLLAFLVLVGRGKWMGTGDIKFGIILGLLLGMPKAVVALFLAFVLGSVVGLLLVALKRKTMKDPLPFAPFLILGTFLGFFWGEKLIEWYMRITFLR